MEPLEKLIYYDPIVPKGRPSVVIDEFVLISNVAAVAEKIQAAADVVDIVQGVGELAKKDKSPDEPTPAVDLHSTAQTLVLGRMILDLSDIGRLTSVKTEQPYDLNPWKETTITTLETDRESTIKITETKEDYPLFDPKRTLEIKVEGKPPGTAMPGGHDPKTGTPKTTDTPKITDTPKTDAPKTTETPKTDAPKTTETPKKDGSETDKPTSGDPGGSVDPDANSGATKDPVKVAPPDDTWVGGPALDAYLQIVELANTMEFSSNSAYKDYVDKQLEQAGIVAEMTSSEVKAEFAGTRDPAGVEHLLRARGVTDIKLIEDVRVEANSIIKAFEEALGLVQQDLATLDPQSSEFAMQVSDRIRSWDGRIEAGFAIGLPKMLGVNRPVFKVVGASVGVGMSISDPNQDHDSQADQDPINVRISPTGLSVSAGLGYINTEPAVAAVLEPGFYPQPLISLFSEEAWEAKA